MGPPGGGKNHISPRCLRHFSVICLTAFDGDTMSRIYTTILDWHMNVTNMSTELCEMSNKVVAATLELYQSSMSYLLPTPAKSHYTFNLRDFSRIIQGIALVHPYEGFGPIQLVRLWSHEGKFIFCSFLFFVFFDICVEKIKKYCCYVLSNCFLFCLFLKLCLANKSCNHKTGFFKTSKQYY